MKRSLFLVLMLFCLSISGWVMSQQGVPQQPGPAKEVGVIKIYCEDLQKYVSAMSKAPQWKSEKDAREVYSVAFNCMLKQVVSGMKLSPEATQKIVAAATRVEILITAEIPLNQGADRFGRAHPGGVAVLKMNDLSMLKLENPCEKYQDVNIYKTGRIYAATTGEHLLIGSLSQVKKALDNLKIGKMACVIDNPAYKKAEEKGEAYPVWAYFDFDNFVNFAPGSALSITATIAKSLNEVTSTGLFYGMDYSKGNFGGVFETLSGQDAPRKNADFFAPKKFTLAPNLPDKYLLLLNGHFQKPEEAWMFIKERIREAMRTSGENQDQFDEFLAMFEKELGIKIDADLVPACAGEFAVVFMEVPGKGSPYPLFVIKSANPVMAKEFLKKIRAIAGEHNPAADIDIGNGLKMVVIDRNDFNYVIDGDLIYISPSDALLKDSLTAIKAGKTADKVENVKNKIADPHSFILLFNMDLINKSLAQLDVLPCMKEKSLISAFCELTPQTSAVESDFDIFSLFITELYCEEKGHAYWQKQQEIDNLGNQLTRAVEQYSQQHNAPPEKIEELVKTGLIRKEHLKSPLDKRPVDRSFGLVSSHNDSMIYVYGYQPSRYESGKTFKVYGAPYPNTFDEQSLKKSYDIVDPIPMPPPTPEKKEAAK